MIFKLSVFLIPLLTTPSSVFALGSKSVKSETDTLVYLDSQTDISRVQTAIQNPEALNELEANITAYTAPANYGSATSNQVRALYPGVVGLVSNGGVVVSHFSTGYALKYANSAGKELSKEEWVAMGKNDVFDLASLTKLFTAILTLQQIERGVIGLETKVGSILPGFSVGTGVEGKENITVKMLLTHTAGFDADPTPSLWNGYSTLDARKRAVLKTPVINTPGTKYLYSDLSFMSLQLLLELISGRPLDDLLQQELITPLGMNSTFFNKGNIEFTKEELIRKRIVSTEYQIEVLGSVEPQRRQPVWGSVHDENAWGLNGVAGHAGLYSSAPDVAIFCQMILNNGTFNGKRILRQGSVDSIFTDYNTGFPGNAHSLGFELNQNYWSGPMRGLQTAGHTGYTGTSLAIDRPSGTFWVLLTNRVHPNRNWSSINVARINMGYYVAKALGRVV